MKRISPLHSYPKILPELTPEQVEAREGFMKLWHEVLPAKYQMIERFDHQGAFRHPVPKGCRTLEIGAGLGAHLEFEDLDAQDYTANELRPEMAKRLVERFPKVKTIIGDLQVGLDLPDNSFDRVVIVHVLEHLPDLPRAADEIDRLLAPGGYVQAVIPSEGGLSYALARRISAQRVFEKAFKMPYGPIVACEHVSTAPEVMKVMSDRFDLEWRRYFPFAFLPIWQLNLVFGTLWRSRKKPA